MSKIQRKDRMGTYVPGILITAGVVTLCLLVLIPIQSAWPEDMAVGAWLGILVEMLRALLLGLITAGVCLAGISLLSNRNSVDHGVAHLERIESLLQQQLKSVRELVGMAGLSDQAKSLIFYEREVDALRESVNALLMKQDYVGAEAMISRVESRLGLTEVAETLRSEITHTRDSTSDDKVLEAVNRVRDILNDRQWSRAKRDAERLLALFPNHRVVSELPGEIRQAWNAYKRQLLKQYGEAVRVNDVERSIELLKELDKYLTPQEGAALAESARDVFKKKLHNLGVQFAIAVADQNWAFAVATGEEIVNEYPNSRMAREVREKLDLLRDYVTGVRQPGPTGVEQADSSFVSEHPMETPPSVGE
ncbi:MAG: hypothetical protein JXA11_07765 [Phycisphaerae bacterium]|nr:hypothetical protein [Phycisphaerae bacterium]